MYKKKKKNYFNAEKKNHDKIELKLYRLKTFILFMSTIFVTNLKAIL